MKTIAGGFSVDITNDEIRIAQRLMKTLDRIAGIDGIAVVTIGFRVEGGDTIVIGYGETGEPSIIEIRCPPT